MAENRVLLRISRYLHLTLIIVPGLATIVACGGGGDGGTDEKDPGSAPTITDVNLGSTNSISLTFTVDFADPDGDVSTITTTLYDGNGSLLADKTDVLEGASGIKDGYLTGGASFPSLDLGHYSMGFAVTDEKGNHSAVSCLNFHIEGGFGTAVNYDNSFLRDTVIGDLNGDGLNDVAVINDVNSGLVNIYYQNASSGLQDPVIIESSIEITGITIADVNNDGKKDLIIAGQYQIFSGGFAGRIIVMLQDPVSGELGSPQEYTVNSNNVYYIATGDLNEDGRDDIAAVIGNGIALFFQDNEGSLSSGVDINTSSNFSHHIIIADLNNDGKNDLITQCEDKGMAVIKQISQGEFSTTPDIYSYTGTYDPDFVFFSYAVGDLNGDHLTDIVALYRGTYSNFYSNIDVFLQNSYGRLGNATQFATSGGRDFYSVKVADITGDGLDDLLIDDAGSIRLYKQTSGFIYSNVYDSYSFAPHTTLESGGNQPLSIGDVTGDGRLDAVVSFRHDGLYVIPYANNIEVP
jgi:hypothetical protein